MELMDKVRINDLARELEVKSKAVLDYLPTLGVKEKKSHSSSIDADVAEKLRQHFGKQAEAAGAEKARARAAAEAGIKTKIDLSKISKPGDVLKAIGRKTSPEAVAPAKPESRPVARPEAPADGTKPAARAPIPSAAKPVAVPSISASATTETAGGKAASPAPQASVGARPVAPVAPSKTSPPASGTQSVSQPAPSSAPTTPAIARS